MCSTYEVKAACTASHLSQGFHGTTKIYKVLVVRHVSEPGCSKGGRGGLGGVSTSFQLLSGGVKCYFNVLVIMVDRVIGDDGVVQQDQTASAALVVERAPPLIFISLSVIQEVAMSIPDKVGLSLFPWDELCWCCRVQEVLLKVELQREVMEGGRTAKSGGVVKG